MAGAVAHLWVVGPGRLGLALAHALVRAAAVERLTVVGRRPAPPPHPLFAPAAGGAVPVQYSVGIRQSGTSPDAVVVAVTDGQIEGVATDLSELESIRPGVVLHTSGSLGREVLRPLADRGWATGSLHPMVAVADSIEASDRLRGAWFAVEADPEAEALARRLVSALGGRCFTVDAGAKPLYHAGCVFASNFVVALLATARRLLTGAGVERAVAEQALAELAAGAAANVAARGVEAGLTGPVTRGDSETVRAHLARLSLPDRRLYSGLSLEALSLAREAGLADDRAAEILDVLETAG